MTTFGINIIPKKVMLPASNKLKIFNDPIYGFIRIPNELIFNLIEEAYFQRLRRITQMGLSYLVYPGAQHTRFQHALGSMYLMQRAVQSLRSKQVLISEEEENALLCAILLHDIGHGPFSHAMEHSLVSGVGHEFISLKIMERLDKDYKGELALAIRIFKGDHPRRFFNQLVSSQLDMDRLDYLKRDSFYTGVAEGSINADRLISMLNVVDDQLVVEEKGIYSIEKFLMARRFMYWQVYLHKTGLAAEQLLIRVLKRARELTRAGMDLDPSEALGFFLLKKIERDDFDGEALEQFTKLDDVDVLAALKQWQHHPDAVLSHLSRMIIERRLPTIKLRSKPIKASKETEHLRSLGERFGLTREEAGFFVFTGQIDNQAYNTEKQNIMVLRKNGKLVDVASASDQLNLIALSRKVIKYYICYPKLTV